MSFSKTISGRVAKVCATAGESGPDWFPHHELTGTREKLAAGSTAPRTGGAARSCAGPASGNKTCCTSSHLIVLLCCCCVAGDSLSSSKSAGRELLVDATARVATRARYRVKLQFRRGCMLHIHVCAYRLDGRARAGAHPSGARSISRERCMNRMDTHAPARLRSAVAASS